MESQVYFSIVFTMALRTKVRGIVMSHILHSNPQANFHVGLVIDSSRPTSLAPHSMQNLFSICFSLYYYFALYSSCTVQMRHFFSWLIPLLSPLLRLCHAARKDTGLRAERDRPLALRSSGACILLAHLWSD